MTGGRTSSEAPASSVATVAVTGGRGFLGSAIVRALAQQSVKVHALGSKDYDLRSQASVRCLFDELNPTVVVHAAAAVGGIGANQANPGRFLYENAVMGLNILDESRQRQISKFVLVSTTCSYPDSAPLPMHETDIWSGKPTGVTGPYGMAKRLLHEACATYEVQYGLDSSVLVFANLYGPGDHIGPNGHVIPMLVDRFLTAKALRSERVINWGSGRATREFLHVDDAARAVALAVNTRTGASPINIGTGSDISIREVSDIVQSAVDYTGEVLWDSSKPDGQAKRFLSIQRAESVLGWKPRIALEAGLRDTVAWYARQREPA